MKTWLLVLGIHVGLVQGSLAHPKKSYLNCYLKENADYYKEPGGRILPYLKLSFEPGQGSADNRLQSGAVHIFEARKNYRKDGVMTILYNKNQGSYHLLHAYNTNIKIVFEENFFRKGNSEILLTKHTRLNDGIYYGSYTSYSKISSPKDKPLTFFDIDIFCKKIK